MTRVVLGNRDVITRRTADDGSVTVEAGPKGKQATVLSVDDEDGYSIGDLFTAVTHPQGAWAAHAADGATPAWVASDSPGLAALLAEHFGGIEVRELPDDYDVANPDAHRSTRGGGGRGSTFLPLLATLLLLGWFYQAVMAALRTNAGADFQANQMAGTPSATAIAKYVGLTANTTTPAATDTTLTGEITTAGGGLIRKAGVYAHTTGTASYTITTVFTANASDTLPVTIGKRGVFDAATAGNMIFETLVVPTAPMSAVGDQLTLTDTFNL